MARGRPPGFVMDDSHRTKIANSQILNRLLAYAEGKLELEGGQIRAIEILLKKVLPDLSAVTVSGDPESPIKHQHDIAPAAQLVLERINAIAERSGKTGDPAA